MPVIGTGQTVHELVVSINPINNQPISGATLVPTIYKDGMLETGVTITTLLVNPPEAVFDVSWSASTVGTYQLHVENTTTTVIYMSEIYNVKPDSDLSTTVYVGL